jgi:RING finger/CHY zinc finger protein 1
MDTEHNCGHYTRGCKYVCPTDGCNKVYHCQQCHDEIENEYSEKNKNAHKLERTLVKEVVCIKCNTQQPISNECIECKNVFGKYYCEYCRMYDNNEDKKYYHCEDCKSCRVGIREEVEHCNICECCVILDNNKEHKCIKNRLSGDCPCCLDNLFTSTKSVTTFNCGHSIHIDCLYEYFRSGKIACPLCRKCIVSKEYMDLHKATLDEQIKFAPITEEMGLKKVNITCNDCPFTGMVDWHPFGLKCGECGYYNTIKC